MPHQQHYEHSYQLFIDLCHVFKQQACSFVRYTAAQDTMQAEWIIATTALKIC